MLSDTDKSVGETYGAKKQPDEQWADFANRLTYLIDPEGVVRKVYKVKDVAAHPDEVLEDIKNLRSA